MGKLFKHEDAVRLTTIGIIYIFLVVLCYVVSPSIFIFLICFVLISLYFTYLYTQSLQVKSSTKKRIIYVAVSILTAFTVNWLLGSPLNIVIVIIAITSTAIAGQIEDKNKTADQ